MSTYVKMKVKRNKWKVKTVKAKTDLRYQIKEKNRIKLQRNQLKRELAQARQTIKKLQSKNQTLQVNDKVDLVFLVLQFFLIARIGFRAISRVLVVIAPYLGLSKTPCAQTVINWVNRLSFYRQNKKLFSTP